MKFEDVATVDFETYKIDSRPAYPPKPAGVAIRMPGGHREYLAWGHPEGNNCDMATARMKLKDAYSAKSVLFHHAAFDTDVAEAAFGLAPPAKFHDTLFLGFLKDPHTRDLGLKPLGERDLGRSPKEQQELKRWILSAYRDAKESNWGEFIAHAPGALVGKYAISDVDTTFGLFKKYVPEIDKRGMWPAYKRELACAPITLEMERSGVLVDRKGLTKCRDMFIGMDKELLRGIAKRLKLDPKDMKSPENPKGFNLNSGDQLADAMKRNGKFDSIIRTPTGKVSTKMVNLRSMCNDKKLLDMLAIHSVAEKYLNTFISPWLMKSGIAGGRLLPKFNQVRGYDEGGGGTRTGRFSSSDPNMQQVSSNVEESKNRETLLLLQAYLKDQMGYGFIGLRDFILPDEGMVMVCCDYDQQELRLLAHFEQGLLMREYLKNPKMDVHDFVRLLVKEATGLDFPRKFIKTTVFGIVYGMGVGKLADQLGVDSATAKKVRDGVLKAIPGIQRLMDDLKRLANKDKPLETWGGRQYFCEEPSYDEARGFWRSFEYKMLNYLIQPSAADVTKQGMINVREQLPECRIALQVHDELVVMAPDKSYAPRVARAMCDMKMNVPMTATAKISTKSWARAA